MSSLFYQADLKRDCGLPLNLHTPSAVYLLWPIRLDWSIRHRATAGEVRCRQSGRMPDGRKRYTTTLYFGALAVTLGRREGTKATI